MCSNTMRQDGLKKGRARWVIYLALHSQLVFLRLTKKDKIIYNEIIPKTVFAQMMKVRLVKMRL